MIACQKRKFMVGIILIVLATVILILCISNILQRSMPGTLDSYSSLYFQVVP